jgi:hypothetical protein
MYQLILHHLYRKGPYAIDVSGAQNDGLVTAAGYLDHGVGPGSGALLFKSPYARVRVPPGPLWRDPFALKIEVVVRVDALGSRRNLVEGADSFAFFLDEKGRVWGSVNGSQYPGGPRTWQSANSALNGPAGVVKVVPIRKWVRLRLEHDGYASLRVYLDDKLIAANYGLMSGVPSVGAAGVNIGNWTIADQYQLDGAIDEVKIWRFDPEDGLGHFLGRKFDEHNAPCWGKYFDRLAVAMRDPQTRPRILALMSCIAGAQREILRQIRAAGEGAIEQNSRLAEEYRKIWRDGEIDGPEMKRWQKDFTRFLFDTIGKGTVDGAIARVMVCFARAEFQSYSPQSCNPAKCDPAFAGYIAGFSALLGKPIGNATRAPWH